LQKLLTLFGHSISKSLMRYVCDIMVLQQRFCNEINYKIVCTLIICINSCTSLNFLLLIMVVNIKQLGNFRVTDFFA